MNFRKKNEKGLRVACELCDWTFPVMEDETLKDINDAFKSHKCKGKNNNQVEIPLPPRAPEQPKFLHSVEEKPLPVPSPDDLTLELSQEEILMLILKELRKRK